MLTTDDNYERAWERLKARYENKRVLVNTQLDTLFALRPIQKKNAKELELLRATVAEVLESLQALGGEVGHWDCFVVYFVCHRLDSETHEAWELSLGSSTTPPTYEGLNTFLECRVRALESIDARSPVQQFSSRPVSRPQATARVHISSKSTSCAMCNQPHYISACQRYREMTVDDRKAFVVEKRLCYNCLGQHAFKECRVKGRCQVCDRQHHTSIHVGSATPTTVPPLPAPTRTPQLPTTSSADHPRGTPSRESPTANCNSAIARTSMELPPVLLATALVRAVAPQGASAVVRALIDQGSELSFVSEALVQTLQLQRRHSTVSLFGIGSQRCAAARGTVLLTFQSHQDPLIAFTIDAHVIPKLTGKRPTSRINTDSCKYLSNIPLADPSYAVPAPVDVLLGANIYGHLLEDEIRKGDINSPVTQRTVFGWIVSGPAQSTSGAPNAARGFVCSADQELFELVKGFWAQETILPSGVPIMSEEDSRCESHFKETHSRMSDGRFIVRLPFKSKPRTFSDSRAIAARLLGSLHRRLKRDPTFLSLFVGFLTEYQQLGHMVRAPSSAQPECTYYLPHHGVLRESSSTTKLRVVFNGSQRANAGTSLNDHILSGPKIQTDLVDVLLRWRCHPFVVTADVEKMYRQVVVHPDDRDYQPILWSNDASSSTCEYQLTTVTYGLSCAPFLALCCLIQLADDDGKEFPLAAEVIRKNIYVDDVLAGADSEKLLREKIKQG